MIAGNPQELAARITAPLKAGSRNDFVRIAWPLLTLLARGEPVTIAELAAKTDMSPHALRAALQQLPDIEWDEQGRIAGAGLTLRPTPHQFTLDGRTLYTWCALDAMVLAACFERPTRIESRCPASGELVRISATSEGLETVEPVQAGLTVVVPEDLNNVRNQVCANSLFFSSDGTASQWLEERPAAAFLSVRDGYRFGRLIAEQLISNSATTS